MPNSHNSRRDFIRKSSLVSSATFAVPYISVSAQENNNKGNNPNLKIGLIGCGGRGSGAVIQALNADKNSTLVAMCDIFPDRLQTAFKRIKTAMKGRVQIDKTHLFSGFEGYKKLIEAVDVVLLASPPGFRPLHLAECAKAGRHVFCEKPVAVDMPGLRSVLDSANTLRKKNKSLVSGLCWRYDIGIQETIKRIQDGAIGKILAIEATTMGGGMWQRPVNDNMSQMEQQIRNWNKWQWLCGDIYLESHIHSLDMAAWVLGDIFPKNAWGMGGRQITRPDNWGNIFDHHHARFDWGNGVMMTSSSRNQKGSISHYDVHVIGTEGEAWTRTKRISGKNGKWRYRGKPKNMYQEEHDRLFESIRKETPIDNSHYMCNSNKIALMGRAASYTGQLITDKKLDMSMQSLAPNSYEFGDHKAHPIPIPGVTKLI